MDWEMAAEIVDTVYGCRVDFGERYFVCPECGDIIYEEDYPEHPFDECPVCGFALED